MFVFVYSTLCIQCGYVRVTVLTRHNLTLCSFVASIAIALSKERNVLRGVPRNVERMFERTRSRRQPLTLGLLVVEYCTLHFVSYRKVDQSSTDCVSLCLTVS